ncbi:hypothetical protein [Alkalicoccobacillus gibsonii]|uniref:hypothetical protein n=1 Tax=Alkalicoccobacillus gibsonii TaxID=79881 RepID=UPI001932E89B|nr:hypothetical protein [Alkalicoccobacillus gibsonii]MBM0067929.1 hypothetical protein [Alkalicoccobacillus gibsonii]
MKNFIAKILVSVFVLSLFIGAFSHMAEANVHITNFTGTTSSATDRMPSPKFHHFYSSKPKVQVKIKVDDWVINKGKKNELNVQLQKDNGLWWSTVETKKLTNKTQVSFTVNKGTGDYRLRVADTNEVTGYDKPPLVKQKQTKYSGSVTGLD